MFLRLVKRSEVPLAALIPNFLTTLALCCGLASIHFSIRAAVLQARPVHDDALIEAYWQRALAAILLSAIFDALDGRAARLLRVTSKFGAVLDSLSDFVAFGVAPAIILHQWTLAEWINRTGEGARVYQLLGLLPVMVYAVCAGMRLARFTAAVPAAKTTPPSNYFVGMPTPSAAGAVLIPAMLRGSDMVHITLPEWLVAIYTLFIAFLMISRIPMFALKRLRVNRLLVAPLLVLVTILVVTMIFDPWLTVSAVAFVYLISLPFAVYRRRHAPEEAPTEAAIETH